MAILFYDIKETEKAVSCFEKVLKIDPKNKEANYNLGKIYQGVGNQTKAVKNYQESLINRSEINFEIEKFSVSSASLNKFLTISNLSYNSFPIPTIWDPWPGKITENI